MIHGFFFVMLLAFLTSLRTLNFNISWLLQPRQLLTSTSLIRVVFLNLQVENSVEQLSYSVCSAFISVLVLSVFKIWIACAVLRCSSSTWTGGSVPPWGPRVCVWKLPLLPCPVCASYLTFPAPGQLGLVRFGIYPPRDSQISFVM